MLPRFQDMGLRQRAESELPTDWLRQDWACGQLRPGKVIHAEEVPPARPKTR